ncbi:uncharacterized protein LOC132281605 [Cornus florida]|uniref:uncharacterized protein LOC132281605 n=1 Tax=Cornus florida TaxID=4283 RepID=UPI002899E75F|nr:uncharacterized protein LOC132281605 [Cornus florida]
MGRIYSQNFSTIFKTQLDSFTNTTQRRLLKLRDMARGLLKHKIGKGTNTMMWLDYWLPNGPILNQIYPNDGEILQLDLRVKIDRLISLNHWEVPDSLAHIPFFQSQSFQSQLNELPNPSSEADSYSKVIWSYIQHSIGLYIQPSSWNDLITWCSSHWSSMGFLVHKLLLSTAVYFLWMERNNRAFRNSSSPPNTIINQIRKSIRGRLASIKLKKIADLRNINKLDNLQKLFMESCSLAHAQALITD